MTKLENLIEQTAFLLEKQIEAKNECSQIFEGLLSFLDTKITQTSEASEDFKSLEKIYDLISGQAQALSDEAQNDINFLTEQLAALNKIESIPNKAEAQELLNMIIDEGEEIPETSEFKKNVLDESQLSKQNLVTMVDDLKEALHEGGVKEVELLLEAMIAEQQAAGEGEEEGCADDECGDECGSESEEKSGCGDCQGCGSGGCGSNNDAFDLFASLKEYDDTKQTQRGGCCSSDKKGGCC